MRLFLTVVLFLSSIGNAGAAEPDRANGLSAHFLPKRVAEADKSKGLKAGFLASTARTMSLPAKDRPVLQTAADLIAHYRAQDATTQRNGIWIVLTNPAAYSSDETAMLDELKRQCKAQRIPLFVTHGRDLPAGWQRHSGIANASRT